MKGRIKFRIATRMTQPDKVYAAISCAAVRTIIKLMTIMVTYDEIIPELEEEFVALSTLNEPIIIT